MATVGCDSSDASVLLEMKRLLLDPAKLNSWTRKNSMENWYGVQTTMDVHGALRVECLHLDSCDLEVGLEVWASVLEALPHLCTLDLRFNPRLRGNVRCLAGSIPRLKSLAITDTGVTGSLKDIAGAHGTDGRLEYLWAGKTQIEGDVLYMGAFAATAVEINLMKTNVSGNLNDLRGTAPNLKKVSLTGTSVEGPLTNLLLSCPSLEVVAVNNTGVFAAKLEDLRLVAPELRVLRAKGTAIVATEEERSMFMEGVEGCTCDVDVVAPEAEGDPGVGDGPDTLPELNTLELRELAEPANSIASSEERATQYDDMVSLGIDVDGYGSMSNSDKADQKLRIAKYLNEQYRFKHASAAAAEGLAVDLSEEERDPLVYFGLHVELAVALDACDQSAEAADAATDALEQFKALEERGMKQEEDVHATLRLISSRSLFALEEFHESKIEARRGLMLDTASNDKRAGLMLMFAKNLEVDNEEVRAEDCLASALRLEDERPESGSVGQTLKLKIKTALAGCLFHNKLFDECAMIAHEALESSTMDSLVVERVELYRWQASALLRKTWCHNAMHQALAGLKVAFGEEPVRTANAMALNSTSNADVAAAVAEHDKIEAHKTHHHIVVSIPLVVELYRLVAIASFKIGHFQHSARSAKAGLQLARATHLPVTLELKETLTTLRWYFHNAVIGRRNTTVKNRGPGWLATADVKVTKMKAANPTYRLSELPRGDNAVSHYGEYSASPFTATSDI